MKNFSSSWPHRLQLTHLIHGRFGQVQADGAAKRSRDAIGKLLVCSGSSSSWTSAAAAAAAGQRWRRGGGCIRIEQLFFGRRLAAALRIQWNAHRHAAAATRRWRRRLHLQLHGGHLIVAQHWQCGRGWLLHRWTGRFYSGHVGVALWSVYSLFVKVICFVAIFNISNFCFQWNHSSALTRSLSLSLSLPLVNSYKNIHTHYYTAPAMHCTFVIFLFTQLSLLSTPTFQKYNFLSETRSLAMKVTATMKTLEERLAVCERKL